MRDETLTATWVPSEISSIALSIASYAKKFTDVTTITVQADRAGLQLARFGDVRLHGALVASERASGRPGRTRAAQHPACDGRRVAVASEARHGSHWHAGDDRA